ncbi:hypothetical protein B0H17DRAFT_1206407 [Mycena rosella]|uniref:Uncharacterized protein n=1 Tax=Mycena rosella TaxID=1033263 RepID=A0AAD7D6M0_MYCRO|nr:hypothetical protein B0H17DRAFT_1206407 [Mycena rosella]
MSCSAGRANTGCSHILVLALYTRSESLDTLVDARTQASPMASACLTTSDGFQGVASWAGFLPGSDGMILDTHPYVVFDQRPNDTLIATSDDPVSAGG